MRCVSISGNAVAENKSEKHRSYPVILLFLLIGISAAAAAKVNSGGFHGVDEEERLSGTGEITMQSEFDPVAIFLTWQHDPTSTMTIDWHTTPDQDRHLESILHYREMGSRGWNVTQGTFHSFPHSDRIIHRVELRRLNPATTYEFRFGYHSKVYKFRTMPADLDTPVRFVTGGDTSHERHEMSVVAMTYDPDFILWGGDLAYADGHPHRVERWYGWFDGIKENLISEDGRVVPILLTIGNHELIQIQRLENQMTEDELGDFLIKYNLWDYKTTFFFDLFAFPGRPEAAYGVLDFSDYMSVILLDSDHNTDPPWSSVTGPQKAWLEAVLHERVDIPHVFPIYHMPAFPSHRMPDSWPTNIRVREHWVPLFEEYGIRVVFENHDHTYKRTHPIRNGEISPDGVVYIGDGNWGRNPRSGENRDAWYIDRFESNRHGIVVTITNEKQEYLMVNDQGEIFDTYTIQINP